jgi:hypothetical protein
MGAVRLQSVIVREARQSGSEACRCGAKRHTLSPTASGGSQCAVGFDHIEVLIWTPRLRYKYDVAISRR